MEDDADLLCLGYDITPVVRSTTTKCWRWVLTGGSDGRITKWDFFGTLNGKSMLTQIQRSGMVDTVAKGGHMLTFWYNEETSESQTLSSAPPPPISLHPTRPGSATTQRSGQSSAAASPAVGASARGGAGTKPGAPGAATASAPPPQGPGELAPELSPVYSLTIQSEGQWALAGTRRGGVLLYSVRVDEGTCVATLSGHSDVVSCVRVNHDETKAMSGSWDSNLIYWDLATGKSTTQFKSLISQISSIQWHPNNPHLFMASAINGTCCQWDIRTPEKPVVEYPLTEKTPPWILSACYNPMSHQVYVGRRNNTVDVYENDGTLSRTLPLPRNSGPVSRVTCLDNGRSLLIGSFDNLRLWDLDHKGKGVPFTIVPGHHGGNVSDLAVDPDGRFLISASGNRGWDTTGKESSLCLIYTMSGIY